MPEPRFDISHAWTAASGLSVRQVEFAGGPARGRAVTIDPTIVDLDFYIFPELVNRSFHPLPPNENFGVNIPQLLSQSSPEARKIRPERVKRIVFACNTTHANFVRGNAFVVRNGTLIHKPVGAVALDGNRYEPLHGSYTALCISPEQPVVRDLLVEQNDLIDGVPNLMAISGPSIVDAGRNVAEAVPLRLRNQGQTIRNEVNYRPEAERSSFTAFGVNGDGHLISVSMFAGAEAKTIEEFACRFFESEPNRGITLKEMADLLIELGACDGIAGGGSGDTQQFVKGLGTWAGEPRFQHDRSQVGGSSPIERLRGLGAILAGHSAPPATGSRLSFP